MRDPAEPRNGAKPTSVRDPDLERVEEDLRRSLGTKVSLARTRKGGRIAIFSSWVIPSSITTTKISGDSTSGSSEARRDRPGSWPRDDRDPGQARPGVSVEGRRGWLQRRQHPGARGPRRRSAPTRDVHRLHGRPRPPSSRLGSRRQLDRRSDGRPRQAYRGDNQGGRHRHRHRRWPRGAGGAPLHRKGCPGGRPHRAACRRQIRWRRLQGVRRASRGRCQRRERAVRVAAG